MVLLCILGRVVTNDVRACGPTHLLVFDFTSNEICFNEPRRMNGYTFRGNDLGIYSLLTSKMRVNSLKINISCLKNVCSFKMRSRLKDDSCLLK